MIAVKALTPNMPRLETVNVPPPSSGGVIDPVAYAVGQRTCLTCDLAEGLLVGVEHGRHDQRLLGGDGHADVYARVQLQATVTVAAVCAWDSRAALARTP